ncbi:hypothetical protein WID27_35975 (plasmid) [Streptomyces sp. F41]|uniref:hypothetical protein n=1 Tax=Streptomyces sp. F41 TaxID=1795888 RepID=UPI0030CFD446
MKEEEKIRAHRDAGFDMDLGGDDITSVQYQNATMQTGKPMAAGHPHDGHPAAATWSPRDSQDHYCGAL